MEDISKVLNALGNFARLRIIKMLSETKRPLHIKAVSRGLKLEYTSVYRHIEVLRRNKLVETFSVGRSKVVTLCKPNLIKNILNESKKIMEE
ncbi:MAG: winged helix-turn-helix domain-containing protein [Nitrososphaerota archaeon]|nr:winged helix-turn-helix domain-containing protein [Nitrososphaerales archaeon]MDW8045522.1 winged helix-turn-helix domain-containing protein [Nitrososphaerota archaeon]